MTLETFFDKFDQFADAPDAVAKMRELVLTLTFQGKLVDQDPEDESSSILYERIAAKREEMIAAKLIKRAKIRATSKFPNSSAYPKSWTLTIMGEIGDWGSGSTPKRGNPEFYGGDITWLKSGELNDCQSVAECSEKITEAALKSGSFRRNQRGDVLIAMYGATIGKVAILAESAVTNQAVCGCTPFDGVTNRFLFLYLISQRRQFHAASEGGAQPNISKEKLLGYPFPLPPLAEQKRIVAKVDELMALCDRLEAQQQERDTRHAALARASLARFAEAPTPANLHHLFHPSYTIPPADLRKSILTLAVQGKLVPQDPNDEPAEELLGRVFSDNPPKKGSPNTSPSENLEDLPFGIPCEWSASRLGSILDSKRGISYGVIKLGAEPQKDGVFILRCSNVRFRRIDLKGIRKVTEQLSSEYSRTILEGGEVLINVRGTLGGCAVVPPSLKGYNIAREVAVIPVHSEIDPAFLMNVIASPYFQNTVDDNLRGIAYSGLNLGLLRDFLIPIPPPAEQRRIVAKVDQLMALVDELEAQLTASRATAKNLLQATIDGLCFSAPVSRIEKPL
ncbi:MAG: restriction endonuclease subunit S [Luteolibacter sp.]